MMGSSSSSYPRNFDAEPPQPTEAIYRHPEQEMPLTSERDQDPIGKILKDLDQQKLTPCKALAEMLVTCVQGNHGEVMNCIPPILKYEQCVQDLTYESIRKNDYDYGDLNSWKL